MYVPASSDTYHEFQCVMQVTEPGPGVGMPVPGLAGRGRGGRAGMGGRGGRGGAIRTFVPQGTGTTASAAPAWMTKKAPAGAPSEAASSSFATDGSPPAEGPTPIVAFTPSGFTPAASFATASPFATAPSATASSGVLTSLSGNLGVADSTQAPSEPNTDKLAVQSVFANPPAATPMDAESAEPDLAGESASQGTPALFTPISNPALDPHPTIMNDTPMEAQESMGASPLDNAFTGSAMDHTFDGGNGGGSAVDEAFGGGNGGNSALDDAFGGGNGTDSALDNAFGGGDGLDIAFGGGNGGALDAGFGGGLDEQHNGDLNDSFGGALATGDIGQAWHTF